MQALELELVAISSSIAAGCVPCTRYHAKESARLGADEECVLQAVRIGANISDSALVSIWRIFDPTIETISGHVEQQMSGRRDLLCAVGSAAASNDVELVKRFIDQATHAGINDIDLMAVIGLAERIKDKAASHIQKIALQLDADPAVVRDAARVCT